MYTPNVQCILPCSENNKERPNRRTRICLYGFAGDGISMVNYTEDTVYAMEWMGH